MESVITYIMEHYHPLSILLYGSYADGSQNQNSDFDALVISADNLSYHDMSIVDGIPMDVFVYPASSFNGEISCADYVQLLDSKVLMDTAGIGERLKNRIIEYIDSLPRKTETEIREEIQWCKKMLLRTQRKDTEGMYRWHWVLIDSLEIFCDAVHAYYRGPKKALRWMEHHYPQAYSRYREALTNFCPESLSQWILYLESIAESMDK